jgi:hypothetical protein
MKQQKYKVFGDASKLAGVALDFGIQQLPLTERSHPAARTVHGYMALRLAAELLSAFARKQMTPKEHARMLRKVEREVLAPMRESVEPITPERATGAAIVAAALTARLGESR